MKLKVVADSINVGKMAEGRIIRDEYEVEEEGDCVDTKFWELVRQARLAANRSEDGRTRLSRLGLTVSSPQQSQTSLSEAFRSTEVEDENDDLFDAGIFDKQLFISAVHDI